MSAPSHLSSELIRYIWSTVEADKLIGGKASGRTYKQRDSICVAEIATIQSCMSSPTSLSE